MNGFPVKFVRDQSSVIGGPLSFRVFLIVHLVLSTDFGRYVITKKCDLGSDRLSHELLNFQLLIPMKVVLKRVFF